MFTIVCPISKCPKIQQDKNLSNFDRLRCRNNGNLKIYDFLQKLKKVVRIVLYGPAISQLDCRKAGPYQFPYSKEFYYLPKCFYARLCNLIDWTIEHGLSTVYRAFGYGLNTGFSGKWKRYYKKRIVKSKLCLKKCRWILGNFSEEPTTIDYYI